MLTITNGSLEKIQSELKQVKKWKAAEEKALKAKMKQWTKDEKKKAKEEDRKEEKPPKEWEEKLGELSSLQAICSQVIPVKIESITVNYKLIQGVLKKLKDFEVDIKVVERELIMTYKRNREKGRVHLYDISHYFTEFKHVPEAIVPE